MPAEFLKVEPVKEAVGALELFASYDLQGDWVSAERAGFTPTPYGVNIDNTLILDFDENGNLSAVEVLGHMNSFDTRDINLPASSSMGAIRLADIPKNAGTEQFECNVMVGATTDGARVQAIIPEHMPDAAWLSLSRSFYIAIGHGRLASVLFCLDTSATGSALGRPHESA
ncbi:MAG: hypothetical protein QOJ39_2171 [Candidatus Eremiobacteraeota bacterium]|jgi:hypothetical protein|nr:hypothetical protein [Candidatus Eremiobacteraeota bacterium]